MGQKTDQTMVSQKELWTGRIIGGLVVLFLLFGSVSHILEFPGIVEWHSVTLGFAANTTFVTGLTLLVCIIAYLIPRTSVVGAIMLTGYLGGAVAINVRAGSTLFHILFPAFLGIFLWVALFLHERRLHDLVPFKKG